MGIIFFTTDGLKEIVKRETLIKNHELYGNYQYAIEGVEFFELDNILSHPYIDKYSMMSIEGSFEYGNIGNFKDDQLLPISLEEGNWPSNVDHVAIERWVLIQMGYPERIGSHISIEMMTNSGERIKKDYILTGIIKDYSMNMLTSSLQIVTYKKEVNSQLNLYFTSSIDISEGFSRVIVNPFISPQLDKNRNTVSLILFILGGLVIGAVALFIGFIVAILLLLCYCDILHKEFYYPYIGIIQGSLVILLATFVGMTLPTFKILYRSIYGNMRYPLKSKKVRRIHTIHPFTLAVRHIRIYWINNLFYIFILTLGIGVTSLTLLNSVDYSSTPKTMTISGEGNTISSTYVENIKRIPGIDHFQYYKIYKNYNISPSIKANLVVLESPLLDRLIKDKEAFYNGEIALGFQSMTTSLSQPLKTNQVVKVYDHNIRIESIIDTKQLNLLTDETIFKDDTLIVSSQYISKLNIPPDQQVIHFTPRSIINPRVIETRFKIFNERNGIEFIHQKDKEELPLFTYIVGVFLLIFVLERYFVNKYQRLQEYNTYHVLGMSSKQWFNMIWIEGVLLNTTSIGLVCMYIQINVLNPHHLLYFILFIYWVFLQSIWSFSGYQKKSNI